MGKFINNGLVDLFNNYMWIHRRSVNNKTGGGGAKACKIKLGGQRRKKVI